ncbi:hypothetical protein IT400_04530 [Candidatus Nomurabacteria bacterium]|nr:hypothetical protein [Candidatus Nomurabacteria bacterium]
MVTDKTMHSILIKALGLQDASAEKQDEAVESMGAVIYQAVITRALEEMKDETVDEFEKITDNDPTPEKLIKFFMEKIPNFEAIMKEEATAIVSDGINMMSQIGKE